MTEESELFNTKYIYKDTVTSNLVFTTYLYNIGQESLYLSYLHELWNRCSNSVYTGILSLYSMRQRNIYNIKWKLKQQIVAVTTPTLNKL